MAIELPIDRQNVRRWIVVDGQTGSIDETSAEPNRWLVASQRFAPTMAPEPIVLSILPCDLNSVREQLRGHPRSVVLWNADSAERRASVFDAIADLCRARIDVLQFVAASEASADQRFSLLEWGITAIIDQPERLPAWTPLVRRYWSRGSVRS
jgi:hypothetical protein